MSNYIFWIQTTYQSIVYEYFLSLSRFSFNFIDKLPLLCKSLIRSHLKFFVFISFLLGDRTKKNIATIYIKVYALINKKLPNCFSGWL